MVVPGRLILLLTLGVLALHGLALQWLSTHWQQPSVLRPMTTPLFTREIQAQAQGTPVRPAAARAATRAQSPEAAVASVSTGTWEPVAEVAQAAASAPAPAAPAAQPASAPAAASEVVATASAVSAPPEPAPDLAAALGTWPADTRLSFKLGGHFRGPLHGDARVQWQRSGERYQASVQVDIGWLASFSMTSQGRLTPQDLQPQAYEEVVRNNRRSMEVQGNTVVMDNGERVPKPARVQDTASQFVELTHRFATGQDRLEAGQVIELWLARPGGVDLWTYDVREGEPINTARWGLIQTFHLVPRPLARPRGPITAEMWFAPALAYFPVRIKMNLGPQVWLDMVIEKIEQAETTTRP